MGDAADAILDGTLCEACGVMVDGESPGYPRKCDGCQADRGRDEDKP